MDSRLRGNDTVPPTRFLNFATLSEAGMTDPYLFTIESSPEKYYPMAGLKIAVVTKR